MCVNVLSFCSCYIFNPFKSTVRIYSFTFHSNLKLRRQRRWRWRSSNNENDTYIPISSPSSVHQFSIHYDFCDFSMIFKFQFSLFVLIHSIVWVCIWKGKVSGLLFDFKIHLNYYYFFSYSSLWHEKRFFFQPLVKCFEWTHSLLVIFSSRGRTNGQTVERKGLVCRLTQNLLLTISEVVSANLV